MSSTHGDSSPEQGDEESLGEATPIFSSAQSDHVTFVGRQMEDQLKHQARALPKMCEGRENDQQLIKDLKSRLINVERNGSVSSFNSFTRLQHEYKDLQFRFDLLNGSYQSIQILLGLQLRQNGLTEQRLNQKSYYVTEL